MSTNYVGREPKLIKQKSAKDISSDLKKALESEPKIKPEIKKIDVPETKKPSINSHTGIKFIDLIYTWVYWNLLSKISSLIKGEVKMESKSWYMSKTLWVNLIGIAYLFVRGPLGLPEVISDQILIGVLAAINFVLRVITKRPVAW